MSSPSPDGADPDFLALPARTRAQIDATYSRALDKLFGGPASRSRGKRERDGHTAKRRRIGADGAAGPGMGKKRVVSGATEDVDMDSAGGFLPEGGDDDDMGGFIPDDDDAEAGGFVLDDEDGGGGFIPEGDGEGPEQDEGGGFLPDDAFASHPPSVNTPKPRSGRANKVPLSRIPALLSALRLPADDDVLAVFRASATGWSEDVDLSSLGAQANRRRRGNEDGSISDAQMGVELKDFRAVCAALMGGDNEGEEGEEGEEPLGDAPSPQFPDLDQEDDDDEEDDEDESEGDDFDPDGGSSLSSLSDESEYGPAPSRRRVRTEAQASKAQSQSQSASTPSKVKAKGKGKASAKAGSKGKARATEDDTDDDEEEEEPRPARRRNKKKDDLVRPSGPVRLSAQQKEMVRALWTMLKPSDPDKAPASAPAGLGMGAGRMRGRGAPGQSANVLGRDEVKAWVRQLGEMWTDEEGQGHHHMGVGYGLRIVFTGVWQDSSQMGNWNSHRAETQIGDMVSLFSTQHEGRGLSYDDFSQVMVRARIV